MSRLSERVLAGAKAEIERRGLAPYLYASRHPGGVVVAVDSRSEDDKDTPEWARARAPIEATILYRTVRKVELWRLRANGHRYEREEGWKRIAVREPEPRLRGRGWPERLGAFAVGCVVPEVQGRPRVPDQVPQPMWLTTSEAAEHPVQVRPGEWVTCSAEPAWRSTVQLPLAVGW